ncbi:MAG: AAA family ATPase [Bacteroidia bacterium]|nr:ATP-binding protein [Bacteroidia bacterium]MDW8159225.1 AAA family ATPase [Bacteroidia bacterium]
MPSKDVFFPYGISNFAQVVNQGYVFVDKTIYLEKLELQKQKFVSFLRPRRFGKSLFISLLEYYYDTFYKEHFVKLFGKFYIGQNSTPFANSYRILYFNFSGIDTSTTENSRKSFNLSVKASLERFFVKYSNFSSRHQETIRQSQDAEEMLTLLFQTYTDTFPVYLLIDEYDHFTNEILTRNLEEFKVSISQNGYVRKFYEVIKNASQQGIVDRIFITGVSPITLDSLTSGFNILKHLSHEEEFHSMLGFCEEEVRSLLRLVLESPQKEESIMQDLHYYYNGYRFHPTCPNNIYNPDMVLYFLEHFKKKQTYPRQMLDPNIMPDYGKLKKMFEIADWKKNKQVLEEVLEKETITTELIYQFHFENGGGKKEFINFLYYLGNLTMQEEDIGGWIVFRIPNKVIENLYWQYYAHLLEQDAELPQTTETIPKAIRLMALSGNPQAFFEELEKLLQALSSRDFRKFDEKHIKMAIIALLIQANIFEIKSEREISKGGYLDLELYIRPNNFREHHQFALEIKYLKKEQESLLKEVMEEAKAQIKNYYQKDIVLQNKNLLHLIAVVILKDKVYWEEVKV